MPWPRERVALAGAALYTLVSLLYSASNLFHWRAPTPLAWTAFDRAVPFVGWTIWIYLSHFALQAWLVVELARARAPRPLASVALASAAALTAFTLFPTTLGPDWPWRPGPLSQLGYELVARLNTPANSFPSMHVALAALAAAGVSRVRPSARAVAVLWAAAVCVSTLTAKQHTAADVPAGLAVAWLSWRIV